MESLNLQDVRCFRDAQVARLRPLTFLVGENSTGKSTFLAMVRAADGLRAPIVPDFNRAPFFLGAFDQIAHYHGGQAKRRKRFCVGATFKLRGLSTRGSDSQAAVTVKATFDAESAQPRLCGWELSYDVYRISVDREADGRAIAAAAMPSGKVSREIKIPPLVGGREPGFVHQVLFRLHPRVAFRTPDDAEDPWSRVSQGDSEQVARLLDLVAFDSRDRIIATAPVRTTPRRTYDPVRDEPTPEGDHVPMVLAQLAASDRHAWDALRAELQKFGRESGLLSDIKVDRKGPKESDPFQIMVSVGRYPFNLVDVGYGVSQVLPILVDAIRAPHGTIFLLQQPEVHLHPRAQAALGTFLAALAKTQEKRFIIETHSDYMIDRVRTEVRLEHEKGDAEDRVGILFFDRVEEHVEIRDITLDANGEIMDPPDAYRRFFLDEQRRLLGV